MALAATFVLCLKGHKSLYSQLQPFVWSHLHIIFMILAISGIPRPVIYYSFLFSLIVLKFLKRKIH